MSDGQEQSGAGGDGVELFQFERAFAEYAAPELVVEKAVIEERLDEREDFVTWNALRSRVGLNFQIGSDLEEGSGHAGIGIKCQQLVGNDPAVKCGGGDGVHFSNGGEGEGVLAAVMAVEDGDTFIKGKPADVAKTWPTGGET